MQTRVPPPLFDSAGRPVLLGSQLGSGGEGAVYELRDRSELVAKLYHKSLEPDKASKIISMAKATNERLLRLAAWPIEPLRAGSPAGALVGFLMQKITGHKQAFNLYSPKLRFQEFPNASWQFLIRSAANAARAFNMIHEHGHVIGDVNHGNLFVGERATVRLIDCDSYQIAINGSRWCCEVGTPTHQPPEFQNLKTYKGVQRSPNHDNFGLAVIIFQMLFMARHPFSGKFLGSDFMPMERAISEYRFAYGSNAAALQMQPPPASLGLMGVTRDVGLLFERAFSRQGSQPNGRPQAREWVTALQDLEQHLKKCSTNPAHQFVDSLNKCPWCDIEAASGVPLFYIAVVGSAQSGFTIIAFWAKVQAVHNPGSSPMFPAVPNQPMGRSPEGLELQQATWNAKITSGLRAVIGLDSRLHSLKKEIEKKAADALTGYQTLRTSWDANTSGKDYDEQLSSLQRLRNQYEGLPQKRLQELHRLETDKYRLQLHAHMDRCRISHARIKGIGDARKATLQSYGIETAADISERRILAVPGFGPVAARKLQQWRDQQERRFRFDPDKGVDPAAKNKVERDILTEKIDLERKLNEGLSKLTASSSHIIMRRRTLLAQAEQAARDIAQSKADLRGAATIFSHVIPRKWAIGILVAASIGSFMVATHQGPPPPARPQPTSPSVVSPIPSARPVLPSHVEIGPNAQRQPEDGYDWSDANHTTVRWTPRKVSRKNPHVIASETEGKWEPEDGYDWINADRLNDKSVRWAPGTPSSRYSHVVAAVIEGQWRPADAYAWLVNPHRQDDMRVTLVGAPPNQIINPPAPATSLAGPAASSFDLGLADRTELEQWFADLSDDFRRGAEWWAGHRSHTPDPGACSGPAAAMNQQFVAGCEAAKARLTPKDIRRKSDSEYRRGWNNYAGAPAPAPPVQTPRMEQGAVATPNPPDDIASRLNEQELRRLKR